ncbi:MAG: DUF1600 domain-containing protein [Malacoplasma sp.]
MKNISVSKFFDIKNVDNIEFKFSIKIIFQQFLLASSFIIFVLLLVLSYTNGNQSFTLDNLPVSVRLERALFPVFLTWYLFSSIWSIKTGCDFIKSDRKLIGWFNILSFIPLFSIFLFFYFLSKTNKESLNYYKTLLFQQDDHLKEKYKWGSWRRSLILCLWIVLLPACVFFFYKDGAESIPPDHTSNLWFSSFNYFTIQTNAMILLFTTILLFFPGLKIFKNNNLQITITVYIFIVGFAWNAILLPSDISSGKVHTMNAYEWVSTSWFHIVNPIVFVVTSLVLIFKQPYKMSTSFSTIFKLAMVYPTMYLIFVAIIPFTAGVSIYGTFTNPNPLLGLTNSNGETTFGNSAYFALIIGFDFVFLLLISLIWFLDKKINSKKIDKKTN